MLQRIGMSPTTPVQLTTSRRCFCILLLPVLITYFYECFLDYLGSAVFFLIFVFIIFWFGSVQRLSSPSTVNLNLVSVDLQGSDASKQWCHRRITPPQSRGQRVCKQQLSVSACWPTSQYQLTRSVSFQQHSDAE